MALERLQCRFPIRFHFRRFTYPPGNLLLESLPNDTPLRGKDEGRAIYLEGCLFNHGSVIQGESLRIMDKRVQIRTFIGLGYVLARIP